VLVHGFSQRRSVLLLYSWCILLSGLAIAVQRGNRPAMVVLGAAAAVATVYMARLLSRYRSRRLGLPDPVAGRVKRDGPGGDDAADGPKS
jgi:hypothetical protein